MSKSTALFVEAARCIRCGACNALSPEVFDMSGASSRTVRPSSDAARVLVEAARWICPADAIRGGVNEEPSLPSADAEEGPFFGDLAMNAEQVRWSLGDIAWENIVLPHATPELRSVVREMAFSESATYSATQRFLETFYEDIDFSKWISVWFYEETRHPHVLIEWLQRTGGRPSADFEVKGRVSTPFMRSTMGTLVTNVVSEMTASHAYRRLAATSREPVLADIARKIAGDEARHAATFFRFARRHLSVQEPEAARRDRARSLEILQAWIGGAQTTTHPVAQMIERLHDADIDREALNLDFAIVRTRVLRVVGLLLGLPLKRPEDVTTTLRELLARRGQA